ncbi:ComEA family DNA-binding protein [Solimonas marina]|uniref:Helix-hairpin-helix domain-containing protein n=1 Tax=Solimonas marina TaxID=2714601 RepID=A0A969WCA6_9GAMM|nr:helix-hairpin-helix domain-containing protein [Solimonas marina]NKF23923.1 helix-hairpin-helix domain-containing protein [Solimonas marina]
MKSIVAATLLGIGLAMSAPAFAVTNINTADQKALEKLPGVGPAKAQEIIKHRPYKTKADIQKVDGIGPKTYKMIEPEITVGGPAKKN